MSTITALRTGKRNTKRVNLFLDGRFAFSVEPDMLAREDLKVGTELTGDRLDTILEALKQTRCLEAAYRYLGYRPYSEAELRERLQRRGFPRVHIDAVMTRLREEGLTNDAEFARFWAENRATFNPRSRLMVSRELRKKGVSPDAIKDAMTNIDETETAYRAAQSRLRRLAGMDYPEFRKRLADFLRRRGFGYEAINRTIKRAWEERQEQ